MILCWLLFRPCSLGWAGKGREGKGMEIGKPPRSLGKERTSAAFVIHGRSPTSTATPTATAVVAEALRRARRWS